jgi:hydroxymethylpyrimidine/phosphomethylpyrimidine kinase
VKVQEFQRKKQALKALTKAEKKGCSAVLVKGGKVHEGKVILQDQTAVTTVSPTTTYHHFIIVIQKNANLFLYISLLISKI